MNKFCLLFAATALAGVAATSSSAQVIQYGNVSPTGNYAAFLTTLTALGAGTSTITFNDQPLGVLNPSFFPGVTLTPSGDVNTIMFGAGPGQGNVSSPPLSSGEGPHAPSNFLFEGTSPSSLTISFDSHVFGAGLFIIDYFNPSSIGGSNPLTLEAFTGVNGTGTSLGSFSSVDFNFQPNNTYFMGFTSAADNIGSLVYRKVSGAYGDQTGIDDITFGSGSQTTVPEPASLTLIATGLVGIYGATRRRRNAASAA